MMSNQSRESLVEDALARILADAYQMAAIGDDQRIPARMQNDIGKDEEILRKALFGPDPLNGNDRGTK